MAPPRSKAATTPPLGPLRPTTSPGRCTCTPAPPRPLSPLSSPPTQPPLAATPPRPPKHPRNPPLPAAVCRRRRGGGGVVHATGGGGLLANDPLPVPPPSPSPRPSPPGPPPHPPPEPWCSAAARREAASLPTSLCRRGGGDGSGDWHAALGRAPPPPSSRAGPRRWRQPRRCRRLPSPPWVAASPVPVRLRLRPRRRQLPHHRRCRHRRCCRVPSLLPLPLRPIWDTLPPPSKELWAGVVWCGRRRRAATHPPGALSYLASQQAPGRTIFFSSFPLLVFDPHLRALLGDIPHPLLPSPPPLPPPLSPTPPPPPSLRLPLAPPLPPRPPPPTPL